MAILKVLAPGGRGGPFTAVGGSGVGVLVIGGEVPASKEGDKLEDAEDAEREQFLFVGLKKEKPEKAGRLREGHAEDEQRKGSLGALGTREDYPPDVRADHEWREACQPDQGFWGWSRHGECVATENAIEDHDAGLKCRPQDPPD